MTWTAAQCTIDCSQETARKGVGEHPLAGLKLDQRPIGVFEASALRNLRTGVILKSKLICACAFQSDLLLWSRQLQRGSGPDSQYLTTIFGTPHHGKPPVWTESKDALHDHVFMCCHALISV